MVCVSCFLAPVVLFIWYKFIYPILQPLINRFIGNYELPAPFQDLVCPMPKKNKTDTKQEDGKENSSDDAKSDSPPAMKCPFASGASTTAASPHDKND